MGDVGVQLSYERRAAIAESAAAAHRRVHVPHRRILRLDGNNCRTHGLQDLDDKINAVPEAQIIVSVKDELAHRLARLAGTVKAGILHQACERIFALLDGLGRVDV